MGFARTLSSAVNSEGNNNEFVSTGAYLRVLRYAMDLINAIPAFGNADVNGSGTVDPSDALMILRSALGLS